MRGAAVALMMLLGAASASAQEAPLQSEPPDARPAMDGAYGIEPGMTAPKIVHAVAAVYPDGVPVDGGGLHCLLSLIIREDGSLQSIHVVHSAGDGFDLAAIHAVRQSKFEAGLLQQKAVPVRAIVRVLFMPDQTPALPEIIKRTYRGSDGDAAADYPPKVIYQPEAEFSEEARKKKINGTVLVSLLVKEDGLPADVRVLEGAGYGLDEKALDSVRRYKFRPAMKDGKPVAQHISVQVSFHLF